MRCITRIGILLLVFLLGACDTTEVQQNLENADPLEVDAELLEDVGFQDRNWYRQKSAHGLEDASLAFSSHRIPAQKSKSGSKYKYRSFRLSFSSASVTKAEKRATYSYYRKMPSGTIDRVFHARIPDDAGSIAAVHESVALNVPVDSTELASGKFTLVQGSFPKCDRTYTEIIIVDGRVFESVVCESDGGGGGGSGGGSGGDDFYGGGDFGGSGSGGTWWPDHGDGGGGGGGGNGGGGFDNGIGSGRDENLPCSLCVPAYPAEDIGEVLLGSSEEVERATDILVEHAWENHGQNPDEYPDGPTRAEFREMTEDIIRNPDDYAVDTAPGNYGFAFWSNDYGSRGTIVIWRPGADGGTVFSPDDGRDYFDEGRWRTNHSN